MRSKTAFPRYTKNYFDRHGKLRSEFSRGSFKTALPDPYDGRLRGNLRRCDLAECPRPFSAAYWKAYQAALADYVAGCQPGTRSKIGASQVKAGSVLAGFVLYTGSGSFRNDIAPATQKQHSQVLRLWADEWGDHPVRFMRKTDVVRWVDEKKAASGSSMARVFLHALRRMMQYLVDAKQIETDPTEGVKTPRQKTEGHHSWGNDEIAVYRGYWAVGTKARLAFELLLGTAQRQGDVRRMGRQHLRPGNMIHVVQEKTGWAGDIPISSELAAILAATPASNLTFLVTDTGRPYSVEFFCNTFRRWATAAGLPPGRTAHGLRKAACRMLAEAGASVHEIAAVSGHLSLSEVQRYTKGADQIRLANAARTKLETKIFEPGLRLEETAKKVRNINGGNR